MKAEQDKSEELSDLRQRAEARLGDGGADVSGMSPEETRHLLHELRTHQIELEMQNEELRRAQGELMASRDRYSDFYDFAPVGYLTVSDKGLITEANLRLADMLGVARRLLVNQPLSSFVLPEDQGVYYSHSAALLKTKAQDKDACQLRMLRSSGEAFWVQLESVPVTAAQGGGDQLRCVISDITERKAAETVLRDSEERYRQVVSSTTDAVVVFDAETRKFIEVNESCTTLYGYSREEFLKMKQDDITAEPAESDATLRQTVAGQLDRIPLRYHKKKDGTVFPVEISTSAFVLAGRQVACGVIRDITERKQAEDEIRLHGEITANMPGGVHLVRAADGVTVYTNPKFEEIFGYGPGEMVGKHVSCLNAPTDKSPEQTAREIMDVLATEGSWQGEILNIRKDGTPFWSYASVSMFDHPEHGRVLVSVHTDITNRKQAAERIVDLAKFPSENPNPVLRIAADGTVLYRNAPSVALLEAWGWEEGRPLAGAWAKVVADVLQANEARVEESQHDGRISALTFTPVAEAGYVNIYALDITDRKRVEEELKRHREHLEELVCETRDELVRGERLAAIGQVSASIAHDLRNPLGSVRNAAYYLKQIVPSGESEIIEYLGIINQEVGTADRIITNLLRFGRNPKAVKQEVDLAQVIYGAFDRIALPDGVQLRISLDPDPFVILADPGQFRQVLDNLMANAAEAMGDKGEIIVAATRDGPDNTIVFRDIGPGVSPEIRKTLFQPLVTTKARGTGLGLTICRQIIEQQDGTIDLAYDYGPGAAFVIRLPRKRHQRPEGTEKAP